MIQSQRRELDQTAASLFTSEKVHSHILETFLQTKIWRKTSTSEGCPRRCQTWVLGCYLAGARNGLKPLRNLCCMMCIARMMGYLPSEWFERELSQPCGHNHTLPFSCKCRLLPGSVCSRVSFSLSLAVSVWWQVAYHAPDQTATEHPLLPVQLFLCGIHSKSPLLTFPSPNILFLFIPYCFP